MITARDHPAPSGTAGTWRIIGYALLGVFGGALWVAIFGLLLTAGTLMFTFYRMAMLFAVGIPHQLLRGGLPWLLHRFF